MDALAPNAHIAIAGAGLLGRLLGWQLLQRGYRVSIFEAGNLNGEDSAATSAAGMISPLSEAVVSNLGIYQMGLYGLEVWPKWLATIKSASNTTFFHKRGSLLVAHSQDLSELTRFERELRQVLPHDKPYSVLNQAQINALEPDLNPLFSRGLYLEDEAHIDNRELFKTLLVEIQRLGGNIVAHTPVNIEPKKITPHDATTESLAFDLVIDCRGVGSKSQNSEIRGVRGETIHLQTNEVTLTRPIRLMHPRYQLYIVPKPEHHFIIGATQIESEDMQPITLQSTLELSSALYTLAPAFSEAHIIEMDVNLRPAFMDNMPKVKVENGLISANGLFRHGYLLAPAVVEYILARLTGESSSALKTKHSFVEQLIA